MFPEVRRFLSVYRNLIAGLVVAALISFPWWWQSDSVLAGVMSNIFASVAILPFVIWGIDGALRDVERRRRAARDEAIREEFRSCVAHIMTSIVTPVALNRLTPDLVNAYESEQSSSGVVRSFAIEHEAELGGLLAHASTQDLRQLIKRLRDVRTRLERVIDWGVEIMEPSEIAQAVEACALIYKVDSGVELLAVIERSALPQVAALRTSLAEKLGVELAELANRLARA